MVSIAAFHARVRGSFPGFCGFKETKMFLPHPLVKPSIVGILRDREVACSASDLQDFNFAFCVCRAVSSHSSHHQEVFLAQFSQYVHKSGVKLNSFHFIYTFLAVSPPFFLLKKNSSNAFHRGLRALAYAYQICDFDKMVMLCC